MKIHKATVAVAILFSFHSLGVNAWAQKPADHDESVSQSSKEAGRDVVAAPAVSKVPGRYDEVIEALKEEEGGKPTAGYCQTGYLLEDKKGEKLLEHFEVLKLYRTELDKCDDEAHRKFKGFLDAYVEKIKVELVNKDSVGGINKKDKRITGFDSALRFHEEIKAFLDKKEKEIGGSKDKFTQADKSLRTALEGIYDICIYKKDSFKVSDDEKTTQQIDGFKKYASGTTLKEANACHLDKIIEVAEAESASQAKEEKEESKPEKPEHTTAPPTAEQQQTPPAGIADQNQSNVLDNNLPPISGGGPGFSPGPGFNEELNGGPSDFEQQLINELIQARQDAVRPNEIGGSPQRDNSRSFQFPPVSVSPQPAPQNQQPQQQQYPQQQMPPFPYQAMMQPPVATPIPAELLAPRQQSQQQNPNAAAAAAQTQALMEMARIQQQLMQAQMQNQMQMGPYGRGSNINNIRNRTAFRGARGGASNRFMSRGRRVGRSATNSRVAR